MKKRDYLLIIILVLSTPLVLAHVEHATPSVESTSLLYKIFLAHDWLHPIFFILMIYSCYYFRFFSGREISHEPKTCESTCKGCYKSEGILKQQHRFFFWGTLFLAFVHIGEVIPSWTHYIAVFDLDFWILTIESAYLLFALLYLGTCYHFRYVIERLAKKKWVSYKLYNTLSAVNTYHAMFFWLTILTVAIRFILVTIESKSILKAIPGMF